jgi:predicted Ser/Thr protein kinase
MSKGAEFIGIDAVLENLEAFHFQGIRVFQGKYEKFKRIAIDDESEEDLIEEFVKWSNRMMKSNPNNSQVYAMQLYVVPDGKIKAEGTTSFTFKFNEKSVSRTSQVGTDTPVKEGSVTRREMELALELQRSEFERERLESEREKELEEEEEDEGEEIGMIGAIQNAVVDRLPQLIDLVIARLSTPNTQPINNQQMQNLGIGSNIDQIISELRKVDADIESDLLKLLNIAKTNPNFFKVLLTQLRSM